MDKEQLEELMRAVKERESTKDIHIPYQEKTGRLPDFEVSYRFVISPELEGIKPGQGMRSDFLYEGDDPQIDGIHMIWPEFLDKESKVILDKNCKPEDEGLALMWIASNESRQKFHIHRIEVGVKGYWVVGSNKLAEVVVTKILGLHENKD